MNTDSFKGPAPCSSDRANHRLTRHLFLSRPSLSVTQTCSQTHQFPFRRRFRVRGTWICKYANALLSRCWQPQTARKQNGPTFLQNNFILSRWDLTEWLSEEHPVYRMHLLTFYRFAEGMKKKKGTWKWFIFAASARLSGMTRPDQSGQILSLLKIEK